LFIALFLISRSNPSTILFSSPARNQADTIHSHIEQNPPNVYIYIFKEALETIYALGFGALSAFNLYLGI